jgi:protein SCO1/2
LARVLAGVVVGVVVSRLCVPEAEQWRPANEGWIRTAAASILICAAGGALFFGGTDGFRAFTTEQARRISIERSPRAVPSVVVEDQDGRTLSMADYGGQTVAVNFVYTQCASVCALLSAGFQRVHNASVDGDDLQLLSVSFDPRDTPERLREYASHFGADGTRHRSRATRQRFRPSCTLSRRRDP